ncbi:Uncharacterised protein [Bordetella pertussis]|nr:Uncharacterised protein [Bordetella pertussis]
MPLPSMAICCSDTCWPPSPKVRVRSGWAMVLS